MRASLAALGEWLAAGGREVGEIRIEPVADGFILSHRADDARSDLTGFSGAEAARHLAHFDDAGNFRPLKTAPNLRRGWRLNLPDARELHQALEYFYPAMLGLWRSHAGGKLTPVPLRDTLRRQTGMYRVTQNLTDAQAQELIGGFCRSDGGCLKKILWTIAPGLPVTSLPDEKFVPSALPGAMPLLCHEACNLLVAKAREVVKKALSPA